MPIPVDYEILRVIWWLFLGVLLIGFAIMDGFDLGVATLLPFVARTETERRVAINTIGPVWDGNQVWLITGGGAVFAAFPPVYAASFSGFYIAMFLVLASLILRPVGFEFRNKIMDARWRTFWDYALFAGGFVPSLVFGVAFGNLLQGVPFRIDSDMRVLYEGGGLFELLNPFGIMCGLVSVAMLTTHGAVYLTVKAEGAGQGARCGVCPHRRVGHGRAVYPCRDLDRLRAQGLCDHQCDRCRRALEPAVENGHASARTMVRQFRHLQVDDAGAGARHHRAACSLGVHGRPAGGSRLRYQRDRHLRHHLDGRREYVPVPDAVGHHAVGKPDGLGRDLQPTDAVRDADRHAHLLADRACLYGIRIPRAQRARHR